MGTALPPRLEEHIPTLKRASADHIQEKTTASTGLFILDLGHFTPTTLRCILYTVMKLIAGPSGAFAESLTK